MPFITPLSEALLYWPDACNAALAQAPEGK